MIDDKTKYYIKKVEEFISELNGMKINDSKIFEFNPKWFRVVRVK